MVGLGIALALFICVWASIIYELKNAPEMDDNGNIKEEDET